MQWPKVWRLFPDFYVDNGCSGDLPRHLKTEREGQQGLLDQMRPPVILHDT